MDFNRETAIHLWNKSFGKEAKVKDFAGRTIAKWAYNDRTITMTGKTGDGAVLLLQMQFWAARSMRGRFLG